MEEAVDRAEQSSEVLASGKELAPDRESEIQGLQAKIGQLTMGNDFFSKCSVARSGT
jgi:transposase